MTNMKARRNRNKKYSNISCFNQARMEFTIAAEGPRATIPAKMINEIPLPMPRLRHLLSQPHYKRSPRRERKNMVIN